MEVVFDFTTPDTIAFDSGGPSLNEDFRFGLFNTAPALGAIDPNTGLPVDFNGPIFTGAISFNPVLALIPGFVSGLENINSPASEISIRTHNVNSQPIARPPSGLLLLTTTGFDTISGGADNITTITPNSDFQGRLFVEFTDSSLASFDITTQLTDAAGSFVDSHTATVSINDIIPSATEPGQVGVNTNTFDLLVFFVSSGAFGGTDGPVPGSSVPGEPNNGIDISNVQITFSTAPSILCDVNRDGVVDFLDISPLIELLSTGGFQVEADCNEDGVVNFFDISAFIEALLAG